MASATITPGMIEKSSGKTPRRCSYENITEPEVDENVTRYAQIPFVSIGYVKGRLRSVIEGVVVTTGPFVIDMSRRVPESRVTVKLSNRMAPRPSWLSKARVQGTFGARFWVATGMDEEPASPSLVRGASRMMATTKQAATMNFARLIELCAIRYRWLSFFANR